jgi:predicted nucleic acid-binding protein
MPELVISNTSPLFYLHRLRHLDVLQKLYQQLVIPEAVRDELVVGRVQGEDTPDIAAYDWIEIRAVRVPAVIHLITDLGPGEAQVLALALEEPESLVILDDGFARAVAHTQNIRMTGTAGLLIKAKQEGYITAVAPLLDRLLQLGFRLSDATKATILALAQEAGTNAE